MKERTYILENSRAPSYDQTSKLWVVEYKNNDRWEQREFLTSVSAWVFYYEIENRLKWEFLQKQLCGKIK